MKKLDMLFIRACRSKDPTKRLQSVYRRFYCHPSTLTPDEYHAALISIFGDIRTRIGFHEEPTAKVFDKILRDINFETFSNWIRLKTSTVSINERMSQYFVDQFRYCPIDSFPPDMVW